MITLTPCTSKMLKAYGYHAPTETLAVDFGGGKVYHYQHVPQSVFDEFKHADSVGIAFAKLIRGQYTHEVVLDESETLEPTE